MNAKDRKKFHAQYLNVLKHRGKCSKWGNAFCLACFGGGLSMFYREATGERL